MYADDYFVLHLLDHIKSEPKAGVDKIKLWNLLMISIVRLWLTFLSLVF